MTKINQAILFINHFALGLVAPVINLILLDHGATLKTLPLLYMIMAIAILCFEIPSGICADLMGRKKIFIISCILNFMSFFLLIFVDNSLILLITVIMLYGIGRAFSSGSLDALIIDQTIELLGGDKIPMVTTRLAIMEGAGLSLGSIFGGLLAQVSTTHTSNLIIRSALILVVLVLCLLFTKDEEKLSKENKSPFSHIKYGLKPILTKGRFKFIIVGGFFIGLILSSLETYWQPAFEAITTNDKSEWLLGFIASFGFLAVTVGNGIAQKFLEKYKTNHMIIYIMSRGILTCLIVIFALQKSTIGFVAGYISIYLLLGISNIAEATLINVYTPNHMRASVLSLYSFITQVGLMCAGLISYLAIEWIHFSGIWIITGSLLGGYILLVSSSVVRSKVK